MNEDTFDNINISKTFTNIVKGMPNEAGDSRVWGGGGKYNELSTKSKQLIKKRSNLKKIRTNQDKMKYVVRRESIELHLRQTYRFEIL